MKKYIYPLILMSILQGLNAEVNPDDSLKKLLEGNIVTLINAIKPADEIAKAMEGDLVDNAVQVNVAKQVEQLKGLKPVLSKKVKNGEI